MPTAKEIAVAAALSLELLDNARDITPDLPSQLDTNQSSQHQAREAQISENIAARNEEADRPGQHDEK